MFNKFNKNDRDKSPDRKASRAQSNIFVRLAGCALLVYFIVQMVRSEEFNSENTWMILVIVLFCICAAAISVVTIRELIRNYKAGVYSANFYANEEIPDVEDGADEDSEDDNSGNPPALP